MDIFGILVGAGLYIALGRVILRWPPGTLRDFSFAALNLCGVYALFFPVGYSTLALVFVAYVGLAILQYWVLRAGGPTFWAFSAPIAALIFVKSFPYLVDDSFSILAGESIFVLVGAVIGISYFAFRTSYLTIQVRNGFVPMPTLSQYLAFSFFAPTMAIGPISRYNTFTGSLHPRSAADAGPPTRAAMRLLIGAVKFKFLAGILNQLTYSGLMLDGNPHHWIDLIIAAIAYYLYLYCNFSGFCDMAIGVAGLLGISVDENFNNPFAARNMREFWNRWHMTLGTYMRDVVFTPTSKYLTGLVGPAAANHATAIAIALVFVLIGVWHAPGWNYVAFGVMHAFGVVFVHYYTIALKKRLGRDRFRAYNSNRWLHAAAVCMTFIYVTASHFLFANSFADMREILEAVVAR